MLTHVINQERKHSLWQLKHTYKLQWIFQRIIGKQRLKFTQTIANHSLDTIPGAETKQLLARDEDVQVLHGFDSVEHAQDYLQSEMFTKHVFPGLKPIWSSDPEVRIFSVVG